MGLKIIVALKVSIMKLCVNCIHHRQAMNAAQHFCNLGTEKQISPVTGEVRLLKLECSVARDSAGFCNLTAKYYEAK